MSPVTVVESQQRLGASASRRRRRQRAAAYARQRESALSFCSSVISEASSKLTEAAEDNTTTANDEDGIDDDVCVVADVVGCSMEDWKKRLGSREAPGSEQQAALRELHGSISQLSLDKVGCRVVQLALEVVDRTDAQNLVAGLHGTVKSAVYSPHGNYVIQRVIERMPTKLTRFIIHELIDEAADVARHRFGCRVVCRLLEHSATDDDTVALVDKILENVGPLCQHSFAHHVIECILEHALPRQKSLIAVKLQVDVLSFARNRAATYVVEKALQNCSSADQCALIEALVVDREGFVALAENQFGFHVAKAAASAEVDPSRKAVAIVNDSNLYYQLQSNKYGKRVLDALEELKRKAKGVGN
jgi:hypothetical protein